MLVPFVSDSERLTALEKFLKNIKRFDPNYLRFYVSILNLKQFATKHDSEEVFSQVGEILETFLPMGHALQRSQLIIIDQRLHERLQKEYKTLSELTRDQRAVLFDANFFDECLPEIERNLSRLLEEFISLGY